MHLITWKTKRWKLIDGSLFHGKSNSEVASNYDRDNISKIECRNTFVGHNKSNGWNANSYDYRKATKVNLAQSFSYKVAKTQTYSKLTLYCYFVIL